MPPDEKEGRAQPLAVLGIVVLALCGFAVFFVSFLVAPLAVLAVFTIGYALSDASNRQGAEKAPDERPVAVVREGRTSHGDGRTSRARLDSEAAQRRTEIARQDEERAAAVRAAAGREE